MRAVCGACTESETYPAVSQNRTRTCEAKLGQGKLHAAHVVTAGTQAAKAGSSLHEHRQQ